MQRDLGNPFVLLSFSYARCVVILLFPYRLAFISEFCWEFILSSVCLNYMNWVCFLFHTCLVFGVRYFQGPNIEVRFFLGSVSGSRSDE